MGSKPIFPTLTSSILGHTAPDSGREHIAAQSQSNKQMVFMWSYPPTPKQLAVSVCFFVAGASLFAAGVHLSFANIGPQQARAKARSKFIKDRLRKLVDDD